MGSAEGWAREAVGGMVVVVVLELSLVFGRGVCVAREGRERRRTFREREWGVVGWAMIMGCDRSGCICSLESCYISA